jgi:hypothetical protein
MKEGKKNSNLFPIYVYQFSFLQFQKMLQLYIILFSHNACLQAKKKKICMCKQKPHFLFCRLCALLFEYLLKILFYRYMGRALSLLCCPRIKTIASGFLE